jgi:hypothetical protein
MERCTARKRKRERGNQPAFAKATAGKERGRKSPPSQRLRRARKENLA